MWAMRKSTQRLRARGRLYCQHIALEQPERLEKLVLSCSWAGPDTYLTELFRTRREILISCGPLAYLTTGTYLAMPARKLQAQMKSARQFMEERLAAFPGLEVELLPVGGHFSPIASADDYNPRVLKFLTS